MREIHLSKEELKKMFVEANLQCLLAETFPEALEKQIPKMPKNEQHIARRNIEKLKKNPLSLFDDYHRVDKTTGPKDDSDSTPVDLESESFKNFSTICESLLDHYKANQEEVIEEYKRIYLELGIQLNVT